MNITNFVIILLLTNSFISALARGFSPEPEWQYFSSCLQDSSKYSGRPQQSCSLDGLCSSFYFQISQVFRDRRKYAYYN